MSEDFIPFSRPSIGENEIAAAVQCLRSGWLTTGPITRRFEEAFAAFVGTRFAVAVNSATSGLHLALEAAGVGPDSKVVTSPYTFTATAEVIRYLGAEVAFSDIDDETFNIDPQQLVDTVRRLDRVRAFIPVHFAGQACDMDPILDLGREHGAEVVEDAAHSLPTTYKGKTIGSVSELTVFSFYATKTLCTGEGGMVTTNNAKYADRMRVMRLHGINRDVFDRYTSKKASWYYEVVAPGFKYNMPDLLAAIGIEQLKRVEEMSRNRARIAERFSKGLADLPLRLPRSSRQDDEHSWHLYVIRLDLTRLAIDRNQFIEELGDRGIGASVHFIPLHLQPYWRDRYGLAPESFPRSTLAYQQALSLPIYPDLTEAQVSRIIAAVREIALKFQR